MARVFAITTTATSLRLDAQGRAEASFTVSNATGRALRGRAEARASDSSQQSWLSVVGAGERDFPSNGTHQITVGVAAPPGSRPGTFSFRLDMVSAQNPDEDFAEGPTVAFEVPAPAAKKPFPWWIVAVAAAVVLVIGGLTAYLTMREPAAPAEAEAPAAPAPKPVTRLPVQYGSGWVDYSDLHREDPNVYAGFSVAKVGDICVAQGLAQAWGPAGITGQPQIATLPEGCRPQQRMIFNLNNQANTARIDVLADGRVVWSGGGVEFGWISLSGIAFGTGQSTPVQFGPTWINYGDVFAGGAVRKQDGLCAVEGLLRTADPAGVAGRPQIAVLPPECRPKSRLLVNLNNHAQTARVDVLPDGQVLWVAGGADHGWMSLSGMVLDTGEAKPLEFAPTWVNYDSSFVPGAVRVVGGLCIAGGLVKTQDPKGVAARPHIATLPPECRPSARLIFNLNNHAQTARVDVLPNGQILWAAGGAGHGWISLNGIVLVPESAVAGTDRK